MILGTISCKAMLPIIYSVGILNIVILCVAAAAIIFGQIRIANILKGMRDGH